MRISDWSSDVCSSDLRVHRLLAVAPRGHAVVKPPQHLLPVFLHRNRLEAGLFEIGRLGRPVVLVMVRQIDPGIAFPRSEEHTSELQSLMRISYAVFCLKKKKINTCILESHSIELSRFTHIYLLILI